MPRRFDSSSRYLYQTPADVTAEQERLAKGDIAKIEPLDAPPDYISITWLASKIGLYNESHPTPTAIKGTFFIGQGATFSVYRAEYKNKVYAVKQPRLVFEYAQDETHTMRQLYSLHLELRVLTDRHIRAHGNIARLKSIHWEEYPDNLGRYWPSLVMEHADYGTLATCYSRGLKLTVDAEKMLCFAVGDALGFLHGNGVIHGDIKPDNILMFKGEDSDNLVPKLSDFGFSVLDTNVSPKLPGGTPDWEAPEILENAVLGEDLVQSDVYSFGLLLWYIARNGKSPFDKTAELQVPFESREAREAVRTLKKTKDIRRIATTSLDLDKNFYSEAFDLTLSRDPQERDLKSAIICLKSGVPTDFSSSTIATNLSSRTQASELSIREFRHLGYRIQTQIYDSLVAKTSIHGTSNNVQRSEIAVALSKICLECLSGKKQDEAVKWLDLAASLSHLWAKALLYRVSKALGCYNQRKDEALSYLIESAKEGIRIAVDDIITINPDMGGAILQTLKQRRQDQCLQQFSIGTPLRDSPEVFENKNEMEECILHQAARCGEVSLIQKLLSLEAMSAQYLDSRNALGQTPLLLACIAGEASTAKALLDVGACASIGDDEGDTPLHWLHAFEENYISSIGASLIRGGADINACSRRTEIDPFSLMILASGTPLHRAAGWNSGEAVRILLNNGADPLRPNSGPRQHELSTPLWLACTFHNSAAINAILAHLKKTKKDVAFILNDGDRLQWPFLKPVLDKNYYYLNGGMLGRIARHGEFYNRATKDTIQILKDHGASMLLPSTIQQPPMIGHPALADAITLRCLDIVQTVLDISPETIEQYSPRFKQPPLHFAVQQDCIEIMELLLSHGANLYARNGDGITALGNYTTYQGRLEIPRLLLDHGLQFEIPTNGFQTPFFGAIARGSFELAVFVLENTPLENRHRMINAPASYGPSFRTHPPGITILGFLLQICHQSVPGLVSRLFDIVHRFDESLDFIVYPGLEQTALHVLAALKWRNRIDPVVAAVAREVIEKCPGAHKVNIVSKDGKPALWDAVKNMNYSLVDCILDAGGDPNMSGEDGMSPLDLLRRQVNHVEEYHGGSLDEDRLQSIVRLFESYGYRLDADA